MIQSKTLARVALAGFLQKTRTKMRNTVSSPTPLPENKHGRRILVCLDRSAASEACLTHAVSLAKTFGGAITLVHVMQTRLEHPGTPQDALGWEISRQEAQIYLDRIEKEVSHALGQPVEVRIEQGRPAERIVDLAQEIAADLIVLGSHGLGSQGEAGVPAWNLGSTVQQVLASMRSSVFVAHSVSSATTAASPKRILIALDGSLRAESVLPAAVRLASAHGAEILLVHVVQEPLPTALLHAAEDMELAQNLAARLESAAKVYLDQVQGRLLHEGMTVHTLVARHANERQCLLEISQREQVDLIMLSAHGSACDSTRSFGSVTTYILAHSAVPLLVLQDLPADEIHRAQDVDVKPVQLPLRASYASELM